MKFKVRKSQQEIRFFCILGALAISLAGVNSKSHTMRAVSPDSVQTATPSTSPGGKPSLFEEEYNAEELDFDDDFSVLV